MFFYVILCWELASFLSLLIEYDKLSRAQDDQHTQEVSRFQEELADAHSQLQILQKQLDEELAKQPLTNQEVRTYSAAGDIYLNKVKPQ